VVVAQRPVAGEADGGRLPAAVHRDEVDVDVDEQVRLGGALVDLDLLALVGGAQEGEVVGVLGVVLVEQATGLERVVDAVAEAWRSSNSCIRRCRASAAMMWTSSTPASAAMVSTCSMIRWRRSGRRIFGSGRLTSSNAIVSFMPGNSSVGSGSMSIGFSSAVRIAPSMSSMASCGSGA
jgi:hypothetical protein